MSCFNQAVKEESDMIEVLYNSDYGGFHLGDQAADLYEQQTGIELDQYSDDLNVRTDPVLISIYKSLGNRLSGDDCKVKLATIPKKYQPYIRIDEYDGFESVEVNEDAFRADELQRELQSLKQRLTDILDGYRFNDNVDNDRIIAHAIRVLRTCK
jgi:hypothetical protein